VNAEFARIWSEDQAKAGEMIKKHIEENKDKK